MQGIVISNVEERAQSGFGVCNGCNPVVLSDIEDVVNPGFFEVRGEAGSVKFTDVFGETNVLAFDLKELSKFRVKRIWEEDTTATGIVIYY